MLPDDTLTFTLEFLKRDHFDAIEITCRRLSYVAAKNFGTYPARILDCVVNIADVATHSDGISARVKCSSAAESHSACS